MMGRVGVCLSRLCLIRIQLEFHQEGLLEQKMVSERPWGWGGLPSWAACNNSVSRCSHGKVRIRDCQGRGMPIGVFF